MCRVADTTACKLSVCRDEYYLDTALSLAKNSNNLPELAMLPSKIMRLVEMSVSRDCSLTGKRIGWTYGSR
jgi:aspartate/methionine/tyrosine aminotransferase